MELTCLLNTSRSAVLKLFDGGKYHTLKNYRIVLNGAEYAETDHVITSLYGLKPDTAYTAEVLDGENKLAEVSFRTAEESVSLDVRRFGAKGDGVHDDTLAIQTAITCCPPKGRVRVPAGRYAVRPLFLKSHITLELQKGAVLLLCTDRTQFPILPGVTFTSGDDYYLGTWEGNPMDAFASALTGVDVEDVRIIGPGTVDGQGELADWWIQPKERRIAWRPRLLFLCRCKNVTLHGLTFQNSPAWTLHPYFSDHLTLADLVITAPKEAANTDGFDPESCAHVHLTGVHFSTGDDCIAVKAGKIYMGRKYKVPTRDLSVTHCLMENGHGGVTLGSENAGGIRDVYVRWCVMNRTDRGLRVKTRRGRGNDAVVDNIVFDHVDMNGVGAPFVVNGLYAGDPDGRSEYVQTLDVLPVDERTPVVGRLVMTNVRAENSGACAGYFQGVPEKPIERIEMEDCLFTVDPNGKPMQPAMADSCDLHCQGLGIVADSVDTIVMKNVTVSGQKGEKLEASRVRVLEWEDEQ